MLAWAIFTIAALGLFYVLVGYPLLLAFEAKFFPKPVKRQQAHRETVTTIIAVRNGERWLARKLDSVLAQDYPADMMEIIVVSDGSTDATEEIVRSYAPYGVRLMVVPPGGKPAALNAAVPHARGELLFLTDVRQVLERDCLAKLVAAMADETVGVVSGDLRIARGANEEQAQTGLYWRYENSIRANLSKVDSMLGATGPLYLIRRKLYNNIPPDSLLDDVFLPMSVHLMGYRLVLEEDAIATDEPTDLRQEFKRKVRTQAGIIQLLMTFPGLFSHANRMKLHFISLKIGRLLLPYLMLLLLASPALMERFWMLRLLIPQLAFWALAIIDPLLKSGMPFKKLTSLPRAYAVLVSAALFGVQVLWRSPRALWVETRKG